MTSLFFGDVVKGGYANDTIRVGAVSCSITDQQRRSMRLSTCRVGVASDDRAVCKSCFHQRAQSVRLRSYVTPRRVSLSIAIQLRPFPCLIADWLRNRHHHAMHSLDICTARLQCVHKVKSDTFRDVISEMPSHDTDIVEIVNLGLGLQSILLRGHASSVTTMSE